MTDVTLAALVRPGDTLVICVPQQLSRQQFDDITGEIAAELQERLPGVKAVFLNVEQLVVYRPDEVSRG